MDSIDGRQIATWMNEFGRILGGSESIHHIVHAGGGGYTFLYTDGSHRELADPALDPNQTARVYEGLQYISQAAENAFRIVRVNLLKTGS